MSIEYKTINNIIYAEKKHKNEILWLKKELYTEEEILEHFEIWKNKIDEKFASLSGTDKTIEEAKTENEHQVTVDLKEPIKPVGEI